MSVEVNEAPGKSPSTLKAIGLLTLHCLAFRPLAMGAEAISKDAFNNMIKEMDADGSGTVEKVCAARAIAVHAHLFFVD